MQNSFSDGVNMNLKNSVEAWSWSALSVLIGFFSVAFHVFHGIANRNSVFLLRGLYKQDRSPKKEYFWLVKRVAKLCLETVVRCRQLCLLRQPFVTPVVVVAYHV